MPRQLRDQLSLRDTGQVVSFPPFSSKECKKKRKVSNAVLTGWCAPNKFTVSQSSQFLQLVQVEFNRLLSLGTISALNPQVAPRGAIPKENSIKSRPACAPVHAVTTSVSVV